MHSNDFLNNFFIPQYSILFDTLSQAYDPGLATVCPTKSIKLECEPLLSLPSCSLFQMDLFLTSTDRPAKFLGGGAKAKPHDKPVTDPRIPRVEGGISSSHSYAKIKFFIKSS